jgi:hypothetical protein
MKSSRTPVAFAALASVLGLASCSGSNGSNGGTTPAPAPVQSPTPDGGTASAPPAGRAGLTSDECPAEPAGMALALVAPVWGGLVTATFTVAAGAPDSFEVEMLDPSRQTWLDTAPPFYSGRPAPSETVDGKYIVYVTPAVTEGSKDKMFKIRVRSVLAGCPTSKWTESDAFALKEPFAGTTWLGTFEGINGAVFVNTAAPYTSVGPYAIGATTPITHTITFNADQTTLETLKYTITSAHAGDAYADCTIALTYAGTWQHDLVNGLRIGARTPQASAASGSVCAVPAVADFAISQAGAQGLFLPASTLGGQIDYTPLLETPARKATMADYQLFNAVNETFADISVSGPTPASVGGNVNFSGLYIKQ